jgi:hypothetical protein
LLTQGTRKCSERILPTDVSPVPGRPVTRMSSGADSAVGICVNIVSWSDLGSEKLT